MANAVYDWSIIWLFCNTAIAGAEHGLTPQLLNVILNRKLTLYET
jgi:hypothetical protein